MNTFAKYFDKWFKLRGNTIWGKYSRLLLPGIIVLILLMDGYVYRKVSVSNFSLSVKSLEISVGKSYLFGKLKNTRGGRAIGNNRSYLIPLFLIYTYAV
jgi:hypothetical protein